MILACDWIVSLNLISSQLAKLSNEYDVGLAFSSQAVKDAGGYYRTKFLIKGNEEKLQEFVHALPSSFGMRDWKLATENEYQQYELFNDYWNNLDDSLKSGWLDAIGRYGTMNLYNSQ